MSTDENINDDALLYAIRDQDAAGVHQLILNGVDVHQVWGEDIRKRRAMSYNTPLHAACGICVNGDIASLLIDANVSVDIRDEAQMSPLHVAARHQNVDILRLLIHKGAEIDAVDIDGDTPLTHSIWIRCNYPWLYDDYEAIQVLIDANADVKINPRNEGTPLHDAAHFKHQIELMDLLLNKGVVIDALDVTGRTPLNRAIRANNTHAVRELLEWDASPNQCIDPSANKPDFPVCGLIDDLSTPLHQAAIYDGFCVIATLVRFGADLDALDKNGYTPLELATLHKNPTTATELNEEIDRLEQERIKYERKLQMMMGNTEHKAKGNKSWLKVLDPELIRKILDQGVDFEPEDELQTESENVSDNKPGRSSRSSRKHSSQLSRANGNSSDDDSDY